MFVPSVKSGMIEGQGILLILRTDSQHPKGDGSPEYPFDVDAAHCGGTLPVERIGVSRVYKEKNQLGKIG